jgi:hypothetical protein
MTDMDFLIKHALETEDETWLRMLLCCKHTTPTCIEQVLGHTCCTNLSLIDELFDAHTWLAVNRPCKENIQDDTLLSACINNHNHIVERMLKKFKLLTPGIEASLLGVARHQKNPEMELLLRNSMTTKI